MTQGTSLRTSQNHLSVVCLVTVVLLSGCMKNKDQVVAAQPAPVSKPDKLATVAGPTSEHLGLTPAYLEGDWCNTHIQFPDTRSPENRLYQFDTDGSFAEQTDPASEMKPDLVYRYRPTGKIGVDNLLYQVKAVQPDHFVLHIAVNDLHFRRGTCK